MKHPIRQFEISFDLEPFCLVPVSVTDQDRVDRERETERKAKADSEVMQETMFEQQETQ